ncbi:MAG: M48 family metalloprotease [bacterium]|nr:M48 family metalloprotease [bacterium]
MAILTGIVALFALMGYSLFGWAGVLFILGVSLFLNLLTLGSSARLILKIHRARPVTSWEAPQLHQIANALADRADIPVPRLAIYPSDMPNAFALGPRRDEGVVAVSSGLLRVLDTREMTGVLAHEFAHLKNRDSLLSLSAGLFVQAISTLSSLFGFLMLFLFLTGTWSTIETRLLPIIFLVTFAPHAAIALQAVLMRTREFLADRDATLLTGDPRGLANALYKLERYNRYLSGLYRRFRFIYTSDTGSGPRWLRTHPSTEERIQNLMELAEKTVAHPSLGYRPHVVAL